MQCPDHLWEACVLLSLASVLWQDSIADRPAHYGHLSGCFDTLQKERQMEIYAYSHSLLSTLYSLLSIKSIHSWLTEATYQTTFWKVTSQSKIYLHLAHPLALNTVIPMHFSHSVSVGWHELCFPDNFVINKFWSSLSCSSFFDTNCNVAYQTTIMCLWKLKKKKCGPICFQIILYNK